MVTTLGAEQRAGTLDDLPVGPGSTHHLEDAGPERRVEQQRVAPGVREHAETIWRAHDPRLLAHLPQVCVRIGRERIGGVIEEWQHARGSVSRHGAAGRRGCFTLTRFEPGGDAT